MSLLALQSCLKKVKIHCLFGVVISTFTAKTFLQPDIDECVPPNTNDCNMTTSICVNTIGSFKCRCREAFIDQDPSNPGRNCTPVFDECRMQIRPRCALNAVCTNNPTPREYLASVYLFLEPEEVWSTSIIVLLVSV